MLMLAQTSQSSEIREPKPAALNGRRSVRLNAEEEASLARAWRESGDAAARERLVTANLGLVVAIAQRYRNSGVPLEELIAEGNLGLISAVDGFDPDCGSRLSTYAAYWIRQGICRAFAASSPRGRLNGRDRRDLHAMERATIELYSRSGEFPTDAELAQELGWTPQRVSACRAIHTAHARPTSLDQTGTGAPKPLPPADPHTPESTSQEAAAATLETLFCGLAPFERAAVEMRFGLRGGEPRSVDAIAVSLGRTRRETRRALRQGLAHLSRRGHAAGRGSPERVMVEELAGADSE